MDLFSDSSESEWENDLVDPEYIKEETDTDDEETESSECSGSDEKATKQGESPMNN